MARYVDGFIITLPKKNLPQYKKMANPLISFGLSMEL